MRIPNLLSALSGTCQICFLIMVSSKVNCFPDRLADLMIKESCPATPKITVRSLICENGTGAQHDLPVLQYLVQNNNGELEEPPTKHFQCGKRMEITISCQASQPITWTYDGPKDPNLHHVIALSKASRTTSREWSENATFCSEISFNVDITTDADIAGRYTCAFSESHNSSLGKHDSSKHSQSKQKSFLYLFWNETQKTELLGKTGIPGSNHPEVIIPCKSNDSSLPVTLEKLDSQPTGFRAVTADEFHFTYDNLVGFHLKPNPASAEDIRGTYKCVWKGSEVEFVVDSKFEIYEKAKRTDDLQIHVSLCRNDSKYTANCASKSGETALKMQILECENHVHCSLIWEASPQYLMSMPKDTPRPLVEGNCETEPALTLEPKQSGVIICSTEDGEKYQYADFFLEKSFTKGKNETRKEMLFSSALAPLILTSPISMEDNIEDVEDVNEYIYVTNLLNISCNAAQYLFSDGVRLDVKYKNGSIGPPEVLASTKESSGGYYRYEWQVNVTSTDIQNYICKAPLLDSSDWMTNSTKNITVICGMSPVILKDIPETTDPQVTFDDDATDIRLSCAAEGIPQPEIYWSKGNQEFPKMHQNISKYNDKTRADNVTISWLEIPVVRNLGLDLGGTWVCNASNDLRASQSALYEIHVEVVPRPWMNSTSIIIITITFIFLAGIALVVFRKMYMKYRAGRLPEELQMSEQDTRRPFTEDDSLLSQIGNSANSQNNS